MQKFAIMGHGVVGSGVAEIFLNSKDKIEAKSCDKIELSHILDLREFDVPYKKIFTKDVKDIINDKETTIVVECMGGLHPAYDFVKECLLEGKSVITSNKELVAEKGDELLQIAKDKGVRFLFEASTGGGIPVLRPMVMCLAHDEIKEIRGILNGTTNYILTMMIQNGMSYDDALKNAQELGYAEKDPTADVDGIDACRKISILASLASGYRVSPQNVDTCGIRKVTLEDVNNAAKINKVIKLIGRAVKNEDGTMSLSVSPCLIDKSSPLSKVDDVFNAVMLKCKYTGDVMFYGRGAGKEPTASAIIADLVTVVRNDKEYPYTYSNDKDISATCENLECAFYITSKDKLDISGKLSDFSFVTPSMKEKELDSYLECKGIKANTVMRILE